MAAVTEPFRAAPPTLADVRDELEEDIYPNAVLQGCETALVLFCARWYGRQDAYWFAQAGFREVFCVDTDKERLMGQMMPLYPDCGWSWHVGDAWETAEGLAADGYEVDVVSLDPFTNMFDRCAASIDLWCSLARRAVILGTGVNTAVTAPKGWRITEVLKRSEYDGGVFWHVLEPV